MICSGRLKSLKTVSIFSSLGTNLFLFLGHPNSSVFVILWGWLSLPVFLELVFLVEKSQKERNNMMCAASNVCTKFAKTLFLSELWRSSRVVMCLCLRMRERRA